MSESRRVRGVTATGSVETVPGLGICHSRLLFAELDLESAGCGDEFEVGWEQALVTPALDTEDDSDPGGIERLLC